MPDAAIFQSSTICTDCARKWMRNAWETAAETRQCPHCSKPLITWAEAPDDTKWSRPYSAYNLTDEALYCPACGLHEECSEDFSADSDDWPQFADIMCPNDEGEYCDDCHAEIVAPTDDYRAAQVTNDIVANLPDAIRGNDAEVNAREILRGLLDELGDDETLFTLTRELCPDAAAEFAAQPDDPEEMLLTCIRQCASMHPSTKSWLADGNLTRILERL